MNYVLDTNPFRPRSTPQDAPSGAIIYLMAKTLTPGMVMTVQNQQVGQNAFAFQEGFK